MSLRPYQLDAIKRARLALTQSPRRSVLVVSPTGSGKTTIASEIARSAVERGRRVLWLAHRSELVEQGFDRLKEFGLSCGAISASASRAPNPFAPVQVASIQTLLARPDQRPSADVVIWDEAHHAPSDLWSGLAEHYASSALLGFTATPERSDGKGLGAIYDQIVVAVSVSELVELGFLVPVPYEALIRPGAKLRPGQIAQRPVDAWRTHASGRQTIVFSPSVSAATDHASEFNDAGVTARVIAGEMPAGERALYLDAFKRGRIQVLVNVYVLTEGFDCPATSCVILARGCGTRGTYIQMIGRGLRPAPGKSDCIIIDLHGVSHDHGHPADDWRYSLEGKGIRRGDDDEIEQQSSCRVCGAPIEPGETCAECGTEPREIAPPKVTGDPLVKYAAKRAEGDDKRASTLARWMREGAQKGYKPGFARGRYRHVYGAFPTLAVEEAARELLGAERGAA